MIKRIGIALAAMLALFALAVTPASAAAGQLNVWDNTQMQGVHAILGPAPVCALIPLQDGAASFIIGEDSGFASLTIFSGLNCAGTSHTFTLAAGTAVIVTDVVAQTNLTAGQQAVSYLTT